MREEPRTTDAGPASTSETRATRIETTEVRTSSDVRTSTSAQDDDVRDQSEKTRGDQRDRNDEDVRDQGDEARGDQRDRNDEDVRDQGDEARGDQRDRG